MIKLLVEGWRGINHSFALVNQNQLLHLSRDPALQIYHQDAPFFNASWKNDGDGFDEEEAEVIHSLKPAPRGVAMDAIYRIYVPFRFDAGHARKTFVFCTSEHGRIASQFLHGDARKIGGGDDACDLITPSNWSRRGLMEYGYGSRIHVVPCGIDPLLFGPAKDAEKKALRKHLKLPAHGFIFLNIGAMTWNKGIGPLLRAFASHRKAYPNSYLLLKGSESLYGDFFSRAVKDALASNQSEVSAALKAIIYSGNDLPPESLAALYRASDAYVSPYLAEGFNLPVLEAIASGLPVIATAGGPTDDFCRDEFTLKVASQIVKSKIGRYLEPDIGSLIDQMSKMVENGDIRSNARNLGPVWAKENYSWAVVTKQLARLLTAT